MADIKLSKNMTNMRDTYSPTYRTEEWSQKFLTLLSIDPGAYAGLAAELGHSYSRAENSGLQPLTIPKIYHLAGGVTELDVYDVDSPEPLKGKVGKLSIDMKYFGAWMRFSDTFLQTHQHTNKILTTYRSDIMQMAIVKRDAIAKDALWQGAGRRTLSITAGDRQGSSAAGAPAANLDLTTVNADINWDDIITENLQFAYTKDILSDNTTRTTSMPGWPGTDKTLILVGEAGYNSLMLDSKYKDYITNALTNDPYVANALTIVPFGVSIRKISSSAEAKVSTVKAGTTTTRSVAYMFRGRDAIADIAIDNGGYKWIEADKNVKGADMIDGLNRLQLKFGLKMWYGAKVLDSRCVTAYVYKSSMDA